MVVANADSLSPTFQDFIDEFNITIVNNMATLSGPMVCGNSAVRDELAAAMASLVGTEDNGTFSETFVDGPAQCGVCGKADLHHIVLCVHMHNCTYTLTCM